MYNIKAFNGRYSKAHYLSQMGGYQAYTTLNRENSTIRAMLAGNYDIELFGTGFGLPYWFESLVTALHNSIDESHAVNFTQTWFDAIRKDANIERIRIPFLIWLQQDNIARLPPGDTESAEMFYHVIDLLNLQMKSYIVSSRFNRKPEPGVSGSLAGYRLMLLMNLKTHSLNEKSMHSAVAALETGSDCVAIDLHADIDHPTWVLSYDYMLINTGIAVHIENPMLAGFIYTRSGNGINKGVTLRNNVGVIDSDYQGEIVVCLANESRSTFEIKPGQRIAQMIFAPIHRVNFLEVDMFDGESGRGAGGLGSTGDM